jgi:hypothetical protein
MVAMRVLQQLLLATAHFLLQLLVATTGFLQLLLSKAHRYVHKMTQTPLVMPSTAAAAAATDEPEQVPGQHEAPLNADGNLQGTTVPGAANGGLLLSLK